MLSIGRCSNIGLAAGLSALLAVPVHADDLRTPTIAAGLAAAADWGTTYHALTRYQLREVNPILRPLERRPGQMISVGAAIDASLVSAWNISLGQKHPKVAAGGLWAMAAFRTYLAIHNLRNERRTPRR